MFILRNVPTNNSLYLYHLYFVFRFSLFRLFFFFSFAFLFHFCRKWFIWWCEISNDFSSRTSGHGLRDTLNFFCLEGTCYFFFLYNINFNLFHILACSHAPSFSLAHSLPNPSVFRLILSRNFVRGSLNYISSFLLPIPSPRFDSRISFAPPCRWFRSNLPSRWTH